MRKRERPGIVLGLMLLLASAAAAQMGMRMGGPRFQGVWNPVIGSGSAYVIEHNGQKQEMEMAVVGKESVEGKNGYWLEISVEAPHGAGEMIMKQLIVLDGENTRIERVIMQPPGRPPMEMPAQMMSMHGSQESHAADMRKEAEDLGSETITAPAGTFTCQHYRLKDGSGEAWISTKATPYGLVKFQGRDHTMTLVRLLTDAKDKITGKPEPFNPMGMMPRERP